jgi:hypothetical protein
MNPNTEEPDMTDTPRNTARPPLQAAKSTRDDELQERKSYQQTLDDALDDTFPASDPIAPGAAAHPEAPAQHTGEAADWHLKPGSKRTPPKRS